MKVRPEAVLALLDAHEALAILAAPLEFQKDQDTARAKIHRDVVLQQWERRVGPVAFQLMVKRCST